MKLSPHFTLAEMTRSQTALRKGIDNKPSDEEVVRLAKVANHILEPIREKYGIPFSPSSGFRSQKLNRKIGGSKRSQHTKGEAVDFTVPGVPNIDVAKWIQKNLLFDQLILEFYDPDKGSDGWVHVSFKYGGENRKEVLTINQGGASFGLPD